VHVDVAPRNSTAERVEQVAFRVDKEHKRHLLVHLFGHGATDEGPWYQALVFTRTKHGANRLAQQLEGAGIRAAAIHGNKSQSARVRALADFKAGKITALVATEVASRGLDIKELPQVVNYELPHVPEDYVHRIGRTGRAGSTGQALSLVSDDERDRLRAIERVLGRKISVLPLDRTQIPRPSGEGKTREPRHVDPRAQQQRHAKPQGQRHRQGGSAQAHGGGQSQGHGPGHVQGAAPAHGRPGSGRPKSRGYRSQA
jgi:ATP-dependent RNA helicase RhlE